MSMIHFENFTHLTFDCYGTLINWEHGILAALRPVLARHDISIAAAELLQLYAKYEAEQEAGPYQTYHQVLRGVVAQIGAALGFTPTETELEALPTSVGRWPAFADSVEALRRLQQRYKLVILSNIDDAMFAETARLLQVAFDAVITAQQVGHYKPALTNFQVAFQRLGVTPQHVLHVAQSLFHDHVPAKQLGLTTVWVNRPSACPGTGVALPVQVTPDLQVPDLQSLADLMHL
jgi:2-haloacid dehalogenase